MRINIKMKDICILFLIWFVGMSTAQADSWPREFRNADGSMTSIAAKPQRILSTSVTVTGTLLAIDAPVVASSTNMPGTFFEQWRELAERRQVQKLWPAGSVDLESAYVVMPDLIVVSMSGADSALDQVQAFQAIAPTIIVDYTNQSWQSLAMQLGEATGLEIQAQRTVQSFGQWVQRVREALVIPSGRANIISYHGPGVINAVAKAQSAHAQLLQSLGFTLEEPNPAWQAGEFAHRDFLRTHYENLTNLTAPTTFLLSANDQQAQRFLQDPILKNLPSVQHRQVYGLGENSFRIDLFSAQEIVAGIVRHFAPDKAASLSFVLQP